MGDYQRLLLGRLGELMAVQYLERLEYRLLRQNYVSPEGEVDIIADHRGTLVFVEVRTRLNDLFGHPLETVGARKQAKVRRVAAHYLHERGGWAGEIRFDVLGILMNEASSVEYELVQDAFIFNWHR